MCSLYKELILSVHRDKIVTIVSHDYSFVEEMCQMIYYLKDGGFISGNSSLTLKENYSEIFKGGRSHV